MTSLHQFGQTVSECDSSAPADFHNSIFKFENHGSFLDMKSEEQAGGDFVHLVLQGFKSGLKFVVCNQERCDFELERNPFFSGDIQFNEFPEMDFKFGIHSIISRRGGVC